MNNTQSLILRALSARNDGIKAIELGNRNPVQQAQNFAAGFVQTRLEVEVSPADFRITLPVADECTVAHTTLENLDFQLRFNPAEPDYRAYLQLCVDTVLYDVDDLVELGEVLTRLKIAPAKPGEPSFRALSLQARADQLDAERVAANDKERADSEFRAAHHPAARALVEAGLRQMCGALPDFVIEWNGSGQLVGALVHLGDVALHASFGCPTAAMKPESVRFTYNCHYVESLADLGKLIQEQEDSVSAD